MHFAGRGLCAGAFVAGLTILASVPAHAQTTPQWRQYGFDARHTLFNPFENTLNQSNVPTVSLQWEFMTGNGAGIAPLSGPALSDGVLYVASQAQTTFTALDAATGTARWIYTGISTFSDPAVGHGHVYTASLDGNLYAFPTDCVGTCTPTWAVPVGTLGTNSPPTLANGNIYIGGYDGAVYAFAATTGAQLWSAQINPTNVADPLNFAPAVSDGRVFVSGDRGVYAFPGSCTTPCAPLWVTRTRFSPAAAPTVAGGTVLVADYQGTVYAIDAAAGAISWRGTVTAIPHAIAAAHGVAYVASGNGELVAYSVAGCGAAVCSPLWTSAPSGLSLFTPTIANGVVYVGALDFIYTQGDVVAYPASCSDGCEPLATLELGGANETPIAVAGGRIYATTVNGNIDSLGLGSDSTSTP
jgi:outer membrane protein assembly factor BamB